MTLPFALALSLSLAAPQQPPQPLPLITVQASDVASQLRLYVAFCQTTAKPEYIHDCLSERFDTAANALGAYGTTAELYRTLKTASHDLGAISRKYASPAAQSLTLQSAAFTTSRPIRPVAPENLAPANAAATAVLEEAELTLLRSSTRSPDVLAFQQVAEIIGSAKVLLRAG